MTTLLLAPMEGLLDFVLRDILTRVGGVDRCVSEFIRVTDTLMPERVFLRYVPELLQGSKTTSGVPVRPQLLGSDPMCLAENAASLAQLGAEGIDLNFGCPSPVVNRHRGGSALLEEPELLYRIVSAVRRAVPPHLPVSAKMRLGLHDDRRAEECALAIEAAGAAEIVVHARTKQDGYRPPAYWERISDMRLVVNLPLVANGEIWTVADALRCREVSGCQNLMLGRGMVADPALANAIRAADSGSSLPVTMTWPELFDLMEQFWLLVVAHLDRGQQTGRLKQWLNLLRRAHPQAQVAFVAVRTFHDPADVANWLKAQRVFLGAGQFLA
ncbi:MAG: tRNA-dihydrouridine synthase [Rhodoferax sp.]|uniref:tRNA dihydrouridine synthase n=1 Tax=Rhodoferax sp. TaxID=50421 RepID=UPI0026152EEA|nr:tRNA-dihydrouridine synthase [Rhodoferax sp.]MDD2882716.1 tRNA-dihydrouridine synthase [Rhodoferax sp.]